ncbi:MAG: NAD-dependent epimerase/dehydratase family protein [Clostridia bacterium]|nr:NAD-dependent epimerase/dehydratase family protein [Clostridia bacterium]
MKKVLVLGATGAMGQYLTPRLAEMGYSVDGVSLDAAISSYPNLKYIQANTKAEGVLDSLLANNYDCIVDFMIYDRDTFADVAPKLLDATDHYIYLSSYRVYANEEVPIKETSPLLNDVLSEDEKKLGHNDYCLYKARGERILHAREKKNWTIIRPAITYSLGRYQLTTLEAGVVINRVREGKTVLLPDAAMPIQATMSWAGDVARMIASLVCNERAMGETYTVSTSEHHTWQEIAEYYKDLVGLDYRIIPAESFIDLWAGPKGPNNPNRIHAEWQLYFDRCFTRIIDNSKILEIAGMKQSELMPLYEGLKRELTALPADTVIPSNHVNKAMDAYLEMIK